MKKSILLLFLSIFIIGCSEQPQASFTWSPLSPKVGDEVQFSNTSTNAKKYDWNLGNMKISSEVNPKNIYENPGEYIIDLTARNGLGTDTKTVTIVVSP